MHRFLLIFFVLFTVVSCQKLSGENDYQLADNCKDFKNNIESNIIKVNVNKGIHYVAVDTTDCSLKIRYEADKVDLSWLYQRLDTLGYLANVADSVGLAKDSTTLDSVKVDKEVNEITEQTSEWDDAATN